MYDFLIKKWKSQFFSSIRSQGRLRSQNFMKRGVEQDREMNSSGATVIEKTELELTMDILYVADSFLPGCTYGI
jgi:hypothetical protein